MCASEDEAAPSPCGVAPCECLFPPRQHVHYYRNVAPRRLNFSRCPCCECFDVVVASRLLGVHSDSTVKHTVSMPTRTRGNLFALFLLAVVATTAATAARVGRVKWCPDSSFCSCSEQLSDQYFFRRDECFGDEPGERFPGGAWVFRECIDDVPMLDFYGAGSRTCDGAPMQVNASTECQPHSAWPSPSPAGMIRTGSFQWSCTRDNGRMLVWGWTAFALIMLCCIGVCVGLCVRQATKKGEAPPQALGNVARREPMHLKGTFAGDEPDFAAEDGDGKNPEPASAGADPNAVAAAPEVDADASVLKEQAPSDPQPAEETEKSI